MQVGALCAVQYAEDNMWYRGQIIAVHGDQIQVRFIDYGNEESKRGNEVIIQLVNYMFSLSF